jgi:hypothetical protein
MSISFIMIFLFLNISSNVIYLENLIIHKKTSLSYCTWREIGGFLNRKARLNGISAKSDKM